MRTDKIRKYLIPNIPYLFILWAFLKLGTAYRLAAGNDFAHSLCIRIDKQDFFALLCQAHAQIDRRCGLADTTFLIGQSNYFAI